MTSTTFADARLAVLKHIAEMLLVITSVEDDMSDAELELQYNDAEEFADLLMHSMEFTITETTDGTITATCNLLDIEAFIDAKSEEFLVAENL
jgi:hypothetical protein